MRVKIHLCNMNDGYFCNIKTLYNLLSWHDKNGLFVIKQ